VRTWRASTDPLPVTPTPTLTPTPTPPRTSGSLRAGVPHSARRLHGELGMIPPAEFEATFVQQPAMPLLASSQ
jgi:hypothetical protein